MTQPWVCSYLELGVANTRRLKTRHSYQHSCFQLGGIDTHLSMTLSACNHAVFTSSRTAAQVVPHPDRGLRTSAFRGDTAVLQRTRTANVVRPRQYALEVQSFKFMKKLGLKKPEFLPDFGKDKRLAVLNSFFTSTDPTTLGALLSDNAKVVEEGPQPKTYNKSEFINLVCNHVSPAIPDFNWGHATSGENDKEGYAVVTCQVSTISCLVSCMQVCLRFCWNACTDLTCTQVPQQHHAIICSD